MTPKRQDTAPPYRSETVSSIQNENPPIVFGPEKFEPDNLLSPEDLAKYLGLSPKSLANMRWQGTGPKFLKIGRIRYRFSDVSQWLDRSSRSSTSEFERPGE